MTSDGIAVDSTPPQLSGETVNAVVNTVDGVSVIEVSWQNAFKDPESGTVIVLYCNEH